MIFCKIFLIAILSLIASCDNTDIKPKDFDIFWEGTIKEMGSKIDFEEIRDTIINEKKLNLYKIKSYDDIYFYAWVSKPRINGKFPIKIRFPGFGRGETDMNDIPLKWFLKETHTINMIVDIRGQGLSTEQIGFENYLTNGLSNKENYIYRGAYMDAVRAVDFIALNPKGDGNIIVTGGSQGGALSIAAAALNPKVTMCIVGFPFLTDIGSYDKKSWPMKSFIQYAYKNEIDLFELKRTLSYFDILNFADKINTPLFLRTQKLDLITPKEGAQKFFKAIKTSKKELYIEDCEGHGCSNNSSYSKRANELELAFINANILIQAKN